MSTPKHLPEIFLRFLTKIGELVGPGEFVSQDTLVAILQNGFNSDPDG